MESKKITTRLNLFRKLKISIAFFLMKLPMPGNKRWIFAKMAGVKFIYNKGDKPFFFIGNNVSFDAIHPENITIYNGVHITADCTLLTHKLDTRNPDLSDIFWLENFIVLKERAFIGTKTVICNDVTIGEGAIVGAGSIVSKDIPPYEIWGGNPARFIKKR